MTPQTRVLTSLAGLMLLSSCAGTQTPSNHSVNRETNPFARASTLVFEAPPFDKIKDSHYLPALTEGMRQQLAEIDAIANQTEAPTLENTIVAMEKSGAMLTRVNRVFNAITAANLSDELEKVRDEISPKLAAHSDAIYMNEKLFARVKAIYEGKPKNLDSETDMLITRYYKDFVHAGALLSEAQKARLKDLNKEESTLQTTFQNKLLAGTKAAALVVDTKEELAGLSGADIQTAADAGKARGLEGKFVLPIQNTTQQPSQAMLSNRATREKLFNLSINRTQKGDANDTRSTIERLAALRAEKAKILGFSSYAAYSLDDQMAKTPERAIKLMTDMVSAATDKAASEAAKMQTLAKDSFKLQPWDWQYYAEQVRKAEYNLDTEVIKPYFSLERVMQDGVFFAANKLYGLTFKERHDIPVYHPDVRVFDVFDADGSRLALWYCDFYKRDNKQGGAWEDVFVDQSGLLNTHPVVYNVANYLKPSAGQPSLLTFDDVTTMFHEFGHALHSMFSAVKYPRLAGTSTARDFVEFPSQFNEHWASEPTVFANYAKHYQTGAPMPAELVARIKAAKTFNQGYATTEYLAAALLDQAWHSIPADGQTRNTDTFEQDALKAFKVDVPLIPPRYRSTYFAHIWSGGYSAGYYAYLWSEVLDHDAFYWFRDNGGMTRTNGQRFREMILSKGSTRDLDELYRAFRGRDPEVQPLLEQRGLIK